MFIFRRRIVFWGTKTTTDSQPCTFYSLSHQRQENPEVKPQEKIYAHENKKKGYLGWSHSPFYQLDAQILYFNAFIILLYLFRALLCWRTIVLTQHLVSSLSLGDCSDCLNSHTKRLTIPEAVIIQLSP